MVSLLYGVILMSVTSSIAFVLLITVGRFTHVRFQASWHYQSFNFAAFFLVVPIVEFGKIFNSALQPIVQQINNTAVTSGQSVKTFSLNPQTSTNLKTNASILEVVTFIWLIGVTLFILWQILCLIKFRRSIKTRSLVTDEQILITFNQCKRRLGVKRKIKLFNTDKVTTPMLVGIFSPMILLPQKQVTQADSFGILSHELVHFKRKDLWIKAYLVFATALHWFNPLVYFLHMRIDEWCEFSCDEKVVCNFTHEQRKQYGMAILNSITVSSPKRSKFALTFASGRGNLERRLTLMLNFSKIKLSQKILSTSMAILLLGCSTIPVFAAEPIEIPDDTKVIYANGLATPVHEEGTEVEYFLTIGDEGTPIKEVQRSKLTQEQRDAYIKKIETGKIKPLTDENFPNDAAKKSGNLTVTGVVNSVVDVDGKALEYNGKLSNAYANCSHRYQAATATRHTTYSDGSCLVRVYDALYCGGCGTTWLLELNSTTDNRVCPH